MFDWKRKTAFLAIPAAAVAMLGTVAVAHASTTPMPANPITASQAAEAPSASEAPEAADLPGITEAADLGGGHTDNAADQNADHQFDGNE